MKNWLGYFKKSTAWVVSFTMLCATLTPLRKAVAADFTVLDVQLEEIDFSAPVLQSGTENMVGALYYYDYVLRKNAKIDLNIDATIEIIGKSSNASGMRLNPFDAEGSGQNPKRFEPIVNTPTGGGHYTFKISFWDHDNPGEPVYLENFALTCVDIDGNMEYVEISGYAKYQLDATTQLTVSYPGQAGPSYTRFFGISGNLDGVKFDNTAAFIAYYTAPISSMEIRLGNTGQATNTNRQYSLNFGNIEKGFTTPRDFPNPNAPTVSVEIVDVAGTLDNRVSDLTNVVLRGTTADVVGQTVRLVVTDSEGNKVQTTAVVQADNSYTTTADLSGLVPGLITVTADVTNTLGTPAVTATDTSTIVRYHDVKFVDWNDAEIGTTQSIIYGGSATAPANPTRDGYIFTGWDTTEYTNVTKDLIVKATYEENLAPDAVDDSATTQGKTAVTIPVLDNDSDPNGQSIEIVSKTDPANGTVTVNDNGTITYTPNDGFTGVDTFTYTIQDSMGLEDTATVTVTVENRAPDAVDDTATTDGKTPVTIPVLDNDSDPDGSSISVKEIEQPANGTVVDNGDGTVTYTPNDGFTGDDTFTYTIVDDKGLEDTATVTVTVQNRAPLAVDDTATTTTNTAVTISVLENDSDPDGQTITIDRATLPGNGIVDINFVDGTITYTPNANYSGSDTFTYTIKDSKGLESTATVTITINKSLPEAVDDTAVTQGKTPIVISVLDNDINPESAALTVESVTQPANGTVVDNGDGTVTYTPNDGFTGDDTFTYTLTDGVNVSTATVRVTVENRAPIAEDDTATTTINKSVNISVLSNDSDPDDSPISVTSVGLPGNGIASFDPVTGIVTYTPNSNYRGDDIFTYTITDDRGETDTATVRVTISNTAPDAVDDTATTQGKTPVTIPVLDNDSDPDGFPLEVKEVTQPANGRVDINAGGTVTYTPNDGFTGVDTFTYTIIDDMGAEDTAIVTVTVENRAPDAVDDTATTEGKTPVTIPVLDNDTDPDGSPISVKEIEQPANGTVVDNGDGTVTYTPNDGFTGDDTFTYTIVDDKGLEDTATVTVTVQNRAPNAVDDTATTDGKTPVTIPVLDNDTDPDGSPISVKEIEQPANGTVVDNGDGTVTYTPNDGFTGDDTFTYTIIDDKGLEDTATVTVTVQNRAPDAVDDTATTEGKTPVTIPVLDNDTDPDGSPISVKEIEQPANGTVVDNGDGTVTYTPNDGFTGDDTFTYTIIDDKGLEDTATVTVTVQNRAPDAVDDTATTDGKTPVTIPVLDNDTDPDGSPISVKEIEQPANGTVVDNGDGTVTYTPNDGFTGDDTFTYTIIDDKGLEDTATVTVTVQNRAPDAVDDTATTEGKTPVTIPVLDNDSDPDGSPISVKEIEQPANGTVVDNGDGTVTYTPNDGFTGDDTFTYTIVDDKGLEDTATVTVTVQNRAPDAVDDTATTDGKTPVTIPVLDNDSDPDGSPISVKEIEQPANGTVVDNGDGTVTYTPNDGFTGDDTFTYTIVDDKGLEDTATVTVTVQNRAPDAVDDNATTPGDTPVKIAVLNNDTDPDGQALIVENVTQPVNGKVVINPDGTVTYTPKYGFTGVDTFTYTIWDGKDGRDTATVTVGIDNLGPVAVDDIAATALNTSVDISVLANDFDANNDTLTIIAVSDAVNGTIVFEPSGKVTYTPNAGFTGNDSFTYTISDGRGGEDTATVTVIVSGDTIVTNTAPDAVDDAATTPIDTSVKISVLANDTDANGDLLRVTEVTQPSNGTAAINADGTVTYTPADSYIGNDSFTYTISDGHGGTDTATVRITVYPVSSVNNEKPKAEDDGATTPINTPVTVAVLANDTDANGDVLTVTGTTQPTNGEVVVNADGTVTYTPVLGYIGNDSFTYTISDGHGGTDTATVNITVYEPNVSGNTAPEAVDDTASTTVNTPVEISVLTNDKDENGDGLTVIGVSQPANGEVVINADGTVTYTPKTDYKGDDTFTYTISDGRGGAGTATVTVTVYEANTSTSADPVARDDSAATTVDVPVEIFVLTNDSDENGDTLTVTGVTQPVNGTVVINSDETVTYTPKTGYTGIDTFTYTISDGHGGVDTATVTVTVYEPNTSTNNDPKAEDDNAATPIDTPVKISVLANDKDEDGDTLTVTTVIKPINGNVVINADGTVTYTPDTGYTGDDSFTYTISDGKGGVDTATVKVNVYPIKTIVNNDNPVAVNDTAFTPVNTPVKIAVLTNDTDPNGDVLTVVSTTTPSHGTVVINPDGTVTYTPNDDYVGTDTFTYTINDGYGGTDTAIVTVSTYAVTAHNTVPVAVDDRTTTPPNMGVVIDVLENDFDADGDTLTVVDITQPANGTAVINPDGTVTYTPNAEYWGEDKFTYTISDGKGSIDTATVTITVRSSNGGSLKPIEPKPTNPTDPIEPVDPTDPVDPVDPVDTVDPSEETDADIAVVIEADKSRVIVGDTLSLTVTYVNKLAQATADTNLEIVIPQGFTVVSTGDYEVVDGKVVKKIGNFAGKDRGEFVLELRAGEIIEGSVLATIIAAITSSTDLINLYDDTSKLTVLIYTTDDEIEGMHERYIVGYPDGMVKPGKDITRAEVAAIFARIMHLETQDSPNPGFNDLSSDHWAYKYIKEVVAIDLFVGDGNDNFRPDDAITRAEFATVVGRYLGAGSMANAKPLESVFKDTGSSWAEYNIEEIRRFKIISGYEDMTFKPNEDIIRSEAITMVNKMLFRGPLTNVTSSFPDLPETHWAFGEIEEATRTHEYRYNADGSEFMTKWIDEPLW